MYLRLTTGREPLRMLESAKFGTLARDLVKDCQWLISRLLILEGFSRYDPVASQLGYTEFALLKDMLAAEGDRPTARELLQRPVFDGLRGGEFPPEDAGGAADAAGAAGEQDAAAGMEQQAAAFGSVMWQSAAGGGGQHAAADGFGHQGGDAGEDSEDDFGTGDDEDYTGNLLAELACNGKVCPVCSNT